MIFIFPNVFVHRLQFHVTYDVCIYPLTFLNKDICISTCSLGKSTFLDHYRNLSNFAVFQEPVDKWRDLDGHNLLQLMYTDPSRHSYTFQS